MKRRTFFGVAGSSASLLTGAAAIEAPQASVKGRTRVNLNGAWEQWMAGSYVRLVTVPSSARPLGTYELRHKFACSRLSPGERAILHLNAITYFARIFLNGTEVGTMSSYVPYEFDVTALLRERENELQIRITDLLPERSGPGSDEVAIGINPGWEAYSGIIRDIWLELRAAAYIENARLSYTFTPQYGAALCTLRSWTNSRSGGAAKLDITVSRLGETILTKTQAVTLNKGVEESEVAFRIESPLLWAPEAPSLYDVVIRLEAAGQTDNFSFRTGFRDFRTRGSRFELNGNNVILCGINRHDVWKDQGFTLTREQMRQDMLAIKAMGMNYVRLVHYPHDRYVVELADEIGLLVSDEPGYWQVNFDKIPRSQVEVGLAILERAIRRDWNSPSVVIWLLANECHLNVAYLREGKALCRKLDALQRLVSAANDMRKESAKPIFEQAEMDFFDTHPYTFDIQELAEIAAYYGSSRPLTFTEWGGKEIGQSQQVMPHTVDMLIQLQNEGKLAGTAFWSWQDLPEFGRIDPEMSKGILESGVVTESRDTRTNISMELRRLFAGDSGARVPTSNPPQIDVLRYPPWSPGHTVSSINLQPLAESAEQTAAWGEFETIVSHYWSRQGYGAHHWAESGKRFGLWREPRLRLLDVSFALPTINREVRPLVLTPNHRTVRIPIDVPCSNFHVLGHLSCPDGYPIVGELGSQAALLTIEYRDGSKDQIPLRNGYEVARGNAIFQSGRIDPIALKTQRAATFIKNREREHYHLLLYSVKTKNAAVRAISYELAAGAQPILIFAAATEKS